MGFFLRRMVGDKTDSLTREQLGRDVLSLVAMIGMPADHAEKASASCALAQP